MVKVQHPEIRGLGLIIDRTQADCIAMMRIQLEIPYLLAAVRPALNLKAVKGCRGQLLYV